MSLLWKISALLLPAEGLAKHHIEGLIRKGLGEAVDHVAGSVVAEYLAEAAGAADWVHGEVGNANCAAVWRDEWRR
jgi:hypothetical protein